MYNFNGFTQKANTALNIAITTAGDLGHTYIGTEHILLGLLKEDTGVAATALKESGADYDELEALVKETSGEGTPVKLTASDFTPRSKRILQMAVITSSKMGHQYVGTEHLLIALLSERDSYAARYLAELGVQPQNVMNAISAADRKSVV